MSLTRSNTDHTDAGIDANDTPQNEGSTCIHVLSGLHEGAVAALAEGPCLIGSAGHCEIVLSDRGFGAEQLLLIKTGEKTHLHVLGSGTSLDDQLVAKGSCLKLNAGATILVAGTRLGYGYVGHQWAADEDLPPKANAAARSRSAVGDAVTGSRVALGIFALVAALGAGLVTQVYMRSGEAVASVPSADDRFADLRVALSALDEPELGLTLAADGQALVAGYVGSLTALQKLNRITAGSGARVSVYAADELVRYASEMIRSRKLTADVNYIGRGRLRIAGQENDLGSLQALASEIRLELPGLQGLSNEIAPYQAAAPASPENEAYVLSGINGVNAGHKVPYISSGDNYIFSGGVLGNGMSVIAIEPSRVLVDDRGNKRTSEVLVQ